jgi:predicted CXXCH cytochrome family protein
MFFTGAGFVTMHQQSVKPARFFSLTLLGLLAAGGVFISCSTLERTVVAPPAIEGAAFVGNRSCFECHTNYVRGFSASPHARLRFEGAPGQSDNGCEACHGPGSKHIAGGGGRGKFIVNPGRDATACFQCHLQTHAEFNLPQHHPVLEKKMNCIQCHDPHGMDIMKPAGGPSLARLNENCAACHREQTRPVVFEHEAMREGCIVCHKPHGSINRKMLVASDSNLCLRCHAQVQGPGVTSGDIYIGKVPHGDLMRMGTCWASGCHTSVHGSNVDPRMRY